MSGTGGRVRAAGAGRWRRPALVGWWWCWRSSEREAADELLELLGAGRELLGGAAISWVEALVCCVDAETCSAEAEDCSATAATSVMSFFICSEEEAICWIAEAMLETLPCMSWTLVPMTVKDSRTFSTVAAPSSLRRAPVSTT